ncbi:MAG: hypothetical protein CMP51_04270 [Flavobacteriales bacterium]|nr:hypothetical protein [Flavobacteriales bacterium]
MRFLFALIFFFYSFNSFNQKLYQSLDRDYVIHNEKERNQIGSDLHTAVKPLYSFQIDSISNFDMNKNWLQRKLMDENFLISKNHEYYFAFNPIVHLEIDREFGSEQYKWNNTRGFLLEGKIGNKLIFTSSFFENQSRFPTYINNFIFNRNAWIIPGQGESRWTNDSIFDYSMSSANFTLQLSNYLDVQFGTGKNFIGDGYRSMILSDNAFNYPYLKLVTSIGKFKYTNLYMEHIDMMSNPSQDITYNRKYMTLHHLSINIGDRWNLGLYETIIWDNIRTPEFSGFDIAYLNPIIFLRPVEFSLNSSDNYLMGINFKYLINKNSNTYGQFVLDEFSQPSIKNGDGWWGNKYSFQLGYKYYDLFNISNLILQIENNYARPYMYSHVSVSQNYGHYYESLSHPLGSNFNELLVFIDYKYNKWYFNTQYMRARYGSKIPGNPTNYGDDIFVTNSNRPSDYGIHMFQGNDTKLVSCKFSISYLINPTTNLKLEIGHLLRYLNPQIHHESYSPRVTNFTFFAIKSDMFNKYYDF